MNKTKYIQTYLNAGFKIAKKESIRHTASLPATNAPDMAVMPTIALTGIANFLIFAAPFTQFIDPVGGSGITTDKAVHNMPQYITNAEVR
jgi:hypothetical protein